MPISVKFGGALVRYKPADCTGNTASISSVGGLTLETLLTELGVPKEQRLLVILNGTVIAEDFFQTTPLNDADVLSLMPPIQAG